MYEKLGNWKDVVAYFEKNFKPQFSVLYEKILEDALFNDIEGMIGSEYAEFIVPLLD